MRVQEMNIVQVPSPNHRDRQGTTPEAVVVHIAEGTMAGMDSWFGTVTSAVSAHFGVGRDGAIHQYVALTEAAWANGIIEPFHTAALVDENGGMNPNRWTVSIEHEGTYPEEPTPAQFEASAQLTAWLFDSLLLKGGASGVAVDRKHILRHADISPVSRPHCPGWSDATLERYIARVQAILTPPVSDPKADKVRAEMARHAAAIEQILGGG